MTDTQARAWHVQRVRDLESLIIRARSLAELDRIQAAAGHEFDPHLDAFMARRVQTMKATK
jgi:hypothetical protein